MQGTTCVQAAGRKVSSYIVRAVLWMRLSLRGTSYSHLANSLHPFCYCKFFFVNRTTPMPLLCRTGFNCGRSINDLEVDSELLLQLLREPVSTSHTKSCASSASLVGKMITSTVVSLLTALGKAACALTGARKRTTRRIKIS